MDARGYAGYAGGLDAMNGEVKHRFPMTPEVAKQYREAMAQCPWTQGKPEDLGPGHDEPLTDVSLQAVGGVERRFTLRGPQPEADRFVAILKPVLAQRHDRVLDKAPRATDGPRPAAEQAKPRHRWAAARGRAGEADVAAGQSPDGPLSAATRLRSPP
ncbi:MAG: hypothetical protein EBQ99_00335 [Planctomycetes bacterium]|nr:hypothetical protein [Planctomycetota bacterium]